MAGTGGARTGAGRPRKSLSDKILEGKEKKAKILKMDMVGEDMPKPSTFLSEQTKGASDNNAKAIYIKTWNWLKDRKCEKLINPQLLEQYSLSVARWQQSEKAVHQFGFLAKHPTTQMPIASPFIRIAQDFLKQSTSLWLQIYGIVKENCSEFYGEDETDIMTQILNTPPPR